MSLKKTLKKLIPCGVFHSLQNDDINKYEKTLILQVAFHYSSFQCEENKIV